MRQRFFLIFFLVLIGSSLRAVTVADLNTITGHEFVRLSRLRISPQLFERIRYELGGFEDPGQLLLLFRVPENRVQQLTNLFVSRKQLETGRDLGSDPDWSNEEDLDPDPIPLAACNQLRLEAIPGIPALLAGRIAKACRLVSLRQRWQLLGVRGMTPALYGYIRRYLEPERRTHAQPWKLSLRSAARSSKKRWNFPLDLALDYEAIELRTALKAESGLSEERLSGNFGLPVVLPRPLASLAGFLRLDLNTLRVTLGHFRPKSPLGLLAGRSGSLGSLRLEAGSQPGFIPTTSSLSPAVTSGVACEYHFDSLVMTAAAGLSAHSITKDQLQNGHITSSLSSLFSGQGATPVQHLRAGLGASWQPSEWGRFSALWWHESFEYDFIQNTRRPELSARLRDRLLLTTGVELGTCLFSAEFVAAFEGGNLAGPKAWGMAAGISLFEGDTKAGLVFHTRSRIHPGILDGLASSLAAVEGLSLKIRTRLAEDLSVAGALFLQEGQKDGIQAAGRLESEWKISPKILLRLRFADASDEKGAATRRADIRLQLALGQTAHVSCSAGLRANERASGAWLATLLELDLAVFRIRSGYADWQAEQGIRLWPMRPSLSQAGDGLLAGVSGAGRALGLALESPPSGQGFDWGGLIRLQEEVQGWLSSSSRTSLDIAFYLKLSFGTK